MKSFGSINRISLFLAIFVVGLGVAAAVSVMHSSATPPEQEQAVLVGIRFMLSRSHSHGEFVRGHENLACTECHVRSAGSLRQQLQALARNALFDAGYEVDFGFRRVSSQECLACHRRKNERHPIHRFNEPRFIEVVRQVPANSCLGCHGEHNGRTVDLEEIGFCKACHADLVLRTDPLDIPHSLLIKDEDWSSCLGCHDFHGNHNRTVPKIYNSAFNSQILHSYFAGGPSPYGLEKTSEGRRNE